MQQVSARFNEAITGYARMRVDVDVVRGNNTLGSLLFKSGTVTQDATGETFRTVSLEVEDVADAWSLLNSPGNELVIRNGVVYADGTTELVDQGVYFIDSDLTRNTGSGTISVNAADRSRKIARAKWLKPWQLAKDTNIITALQTVLVTAWPGIEDINGALNLGTSDKVLTTNITFAAGESSNPWLDAVEIAKAYSLRLYVDAQGRFCTSLFDTSNTSVWSFGGSTSPLETSKTDKASMSEVYNTVVVTAEGADVSTPITVVAQDVDALSPTNVNGLFGIAPKYITSSLITTEEAAIELGQTELVKCKGLSRSLDWEQLSHPAIEAGDCVEWTTITGYENIPVTSDFDVDVILESSSGALPATPTLRRAITTSNLYIIDRLSCGLDAAGAMPVQAREVRNVS